MLPKQFITKSLRLLLLFSLLLSFTSCQIQQSEFQPVITFIPPANRISSLPSAFEPLTPEERDQEWGKELLIGDVFAKEWDLYRAITCYKRALILIPSDLIAKRLQLNYNLVLCYYLGQKYQEAINVFEASDLTNVNTQFPAYNNLVILLYDCYMEMGQCDKACSLFSSIEKSSPETASDLSLYTNLKAGSMTAAQTEIDSRPDKEVIQVDFDRYYEFAKSPQKAKALNAVLPGLGYYYVGQKKAALTSFVINALFTAATYQFFKRGYTAAGCITASLETGWYFGGINGAGIAANEFNQTLFEGVSRKILTDNNCFPVLIFETSF